MFVTRPSGRGQRSPGRQSFPAVGGKQPHGLASFYGPMLRAADQSRLLVHAYHHDFGVVGFQEPLDEAGNASGEGVEMGMTLK